MSIQKFLLLVVLASLASSAPTAPSTRGLCDNDGDDVVVDVREGRGVIITSETEDDGADHEDQVGGIINFLMLL